MSLAVTIPVGIVVARETVDHSWPATRWRVAGLLLDPPAEAHWRKVPVGASVSGASGGPRYHAATLPLSLNAKDIASYQVNLSNGVPSVYVVAREQGQDAGTPLAIRHVSASPFEVRSLAIDGLDSVESVAMPERLLIAVARFIRDACGFETHSESPWPRRGEADSSGRQVAE